MARDSGPEGIRNGFQSLIPAYGLKFSFSALACAPEGSSKPVRGIDPLRGGVALAAQTAFILRSFLHARDTGESAVLDKGVYGAVSHRPAHTAPGGNNAFPGLRRDGLGFCQRKRPERRQRSTGRSGRSHAGSF